MKKLTLLFLLGFLLLGHRAWAATVTQATDTNNVIITTLPISITKTAAVFKLDNGNTINGFREVLPKGLTQVAGYVGYSVVYPNAVNPRASASCSLKILIKKTKVATMRAFLQSIGIDAGANTLSATVLK
jgi:hypothetical protein